MVVDEYLLDILSTVVASVTGVTDEYLLDILSTVVAWVTDEYLVDILSSGCLGNWGYR
jgi:hypothetical protein